MSRKLSKDHRLATLQDAIEDTYLRRVMEATGSLC